MTGVATTWADSPNLLDVAYHGNRPKLQQRSGGNAEATCCKRTRAQAYFADNGDPIAKSSRAILLQRWPSDKVSAPATVSFEG